MGASQSQIDNGSTAANWVSGTKSGSKRADKKQLFRKRRLAQRFRGAMPTGVPVMPFNNHTLAIGMRNPTISIDSSKQASQYTSENG